MRSTILPGEVRAFFFDVPIGKRAVVLDDVTTPNPGSTPDPGLPTTLKKINDDDTPYPRERQVASPPNHHLSTP